jgi:hypothetical protein
MRTAEGKAEMRCGMCDKNPVGVALAAIEFVRRYPLLHYFIGEILVCIHR